ATVGIGGGVAKGHVHRVVVGEGGVGQLLAQDLGGFVVGALVNHQQLKIAAHFADLFAIAILFAFHGKHKKSLDGGRHCQKTSVGDAHVRVTLHDVVKAEPVSVR